MEMFDGDADKHPSVYDSKCASLLGIFLVSFQIPNVTRHSKVKGTRIAGLSMHASPLYYLYMILSLFIFIKLFIIFKTIKLNLKKKMKHGSFIYLCCSPKI